MNFEIIVLPELFEEIKDFDQKTKNIFSSKLNLIKENPFRFKAIHSKQFNRVFRVRLKIHAQEARLIYVILESKIILVCLLDRKKDYKDLEKYLFKVVAYLKK